MSLVSLAIRLCMKGCLTDTTWAGTRVYDQPVDPIDVVLRNVGEGWSAPVIALYTEKSQADLISKETHGSGSEVTTKIYIYTPPSVISVEDGEGEQQELTSDAGGMILNLMGRQVDQSLHYGNEDWVKVLNKFIIKYTRVKSQFVLIELEDGVRIPCLEVEYEAQTVEEPQYGTEIFGAWVDLDAMLRGSAAEWVILADMLKNMIEKPEDLSGYRDIQINHGLSDAALTSLGIAPIEGSVEDEGDEAPVLAEGGPTDVDIEVVPPDNVP